MEALRDITQSINTFVRFFESINYLFCQIRWFEQNVLNSGSKLVMIVGVIISLCVLIYYVGGHGGSPYDALNKLLVDYGPILLVVTIIAYFVTQRLAGAGPSEGGGTFESVFFGNRRRNFHGNEASPGDYEMAEGHVVDTRFRDLEGDRQYASPSVRALDVVGGRSQSAYSPIPQNNIRNGNGFYR
jgi:hypothetical protein